MLELIGIGIVLVAVTVVIHALGTTYWIRHLVSRHGGNNVSRRRRPTLEMLISTAVVFLLLHIIEVMLWAVTFLVLVPVSELQTFETAVYFSLVTFTTLGYGDITLGPQWRILSGIEAMNGILLVGWTTALLFAVVQRSWTIEFGR